MCFRRKDTERSSLRPVNSRFTITARQQLIATSKYQFAGIGNLQQLAKKSFTAPRSIVVSMSSTTRRWQHSPYRRIKSMLFNRPRNIKVIVESMLANEHSRRANKPPLTSMLPSYAATRHRCRAGLQRRPNLAWGWGRSGWIQGARGCDRRGRAPPNA